MKTANWKDVAAQKMGTGVAKRVLIGPEQGAPNFVLRHFTLEAGACSPHHEHNWEHEVFVLGGAGELVGPEGNQPLKPGDAAFVPGGVKHQFRNMGTQPFTFLCIVPLAGA